MLKYQYLFINTISETGSSLLIKKLIYIQDKNPDTKRYRDSEILEEFISLKTVAALRKQSGGLFLAATAAALLRGHLSFAEKKLGSRNFREFFVKDKNLSL